MLASGVTAGSDAGIAEESYERLTVVEGNWGAQYHPCHEDVPTDAPTPRGKPVMLTTFVDANLMADVTTGRSQTGIAYIFSIRPLSNGSRSARLALRQQPTAVNL